MTLATLTLGQATRATSRRSHEWLVDELDLIWGEYFADTPRINQVEIGFHRPWKRRLGVIRLCQIDNSTHIGINSLLSHEDAPYCMTLITVAHELVHYCHGFGSPLPQKYSHPHRGGIVTRELVDRGLGRQLAEYTDWIEENWWQFYAGQRGGPSPV
jgi:hypothetical protein